MKYLGFLLFAGTVLILAILVVVVSILPESSPKQSVIVVPVDPTITHLEANLARREADYQAQLSVLEQTLQQHRADFEDQMGKMNEQIATAQKQLEALNIQEAALQVHVKQLETARAENLAGYQTHLEQLRNQIAARQANPQTEPDGTNAQSIEPGSQQGPLLGDLLGRE